MDRSSNNADFQHPKRPDGSTSPDGRGGDVDRMSVGPRGGVRSDASLIASEFRRLDESLEALGAAQRGPLPTGLADRVFAASRVHLPDSDVLANIADLSTVAVPVSGGRASIRVRWARMALATAAILAVAASSWIAFRPSPSSAGDEQIARNSSPSGAEFSAGRGTHRGPASSGVAANAPANAAAELTLVAMQDPNQYRGWIDEETLGGSEAARLAVPVLRTQGAAIDDIEGELEEILGLPAAGSASSSSASLKSGSH